MENKNLKKNLESVLFICGAPTTIKELAKITEKNEEEIKSAIKELKEEYQSQERGLTIIEKDNGIQMATNPDCSDIVEKYLKETLKEDLTPAALETLAIIAYKGPISRPEIDNIRGVNSSFIVRNLLIRGLVEKETDSKKGNAFCYKASFDFMKKIGIDKMENLPEYEKFRSIQ